MASLIGRLTTIVRRLPSPVLGMGLMMFAAMLSMTMSAIAKELVQELPVFEVVFFRQFFGTLILASLFFRKGANPLRTRRIGMHGLRALFNIVAIHAGIQLVAKHKQYKSQGTDITDQTFEIHQARTSLIERDRQTFTIVQKDFYCSQWRWSLRIASFIAVCGLL